jgi:hypothetical protein
MSGVGTVRFATVPGLFVRRRKAAETAGPFASRAPVNKGLAQRSKWERRGMTIEMQAVIAKRAGTKMRQGAKFYNLFPSQQIFGSRLTN